LPSSPAEHEIVNAKANIIILIAAANRRTLFNLIITPFFSRLLFAWCAIFGLLAAEIKGSFFFGSFFYPNP
jgi:hypothetical protein